MTAHDESAETLLAAVHAHLAAAASALALDDSPAAVTARDEITAALVAHDWYARRLSHDLRNALTAISGQTQLLHRHLNRDGKEQIEAERVRRTLTQVKAATSHATEVSRLLAGP